MKKELKRAVEAKAEFQRFDVIYDLGLREFMKGFFVKEYVNGWYIQSLTRDGNQWIIRWAKDFSIT